MKTVSSISIQDNQSMSVDVEDVEQIDVNSPVNLGDNFFCEIIVRTKNGVISLNLLSDSEEALQVRQAAAEENFE